MYGRANDIGRAVSAELRAPVMARRGAFSQLTLTLFPSDPLPVSKTRTQDDTAAIGATRPLTRWLTRLCRPLLRHDPSDSRLLSMTPARYDGVFQLALALANGAPSSAHRLWHGGAGADALRTAPNAVTDLTLASRGRWSALSCAHRYRQPEQYLKQEQLPRTLPSQLAVRLTPRLLNRQRQLLLLIPCLRQVIDVFHLAQFSTGIPSGWFFKRASSG